MVNDEMKSKILNSFDRDKTRFEASDLQRALLLLQDSKGQEENDDEEAEFVDAFVAMGGNADKSGYVEKSTIEHVIRDFELTIDIGEFLDQIPSDTIDFQNFCRLFEQPFDDTKSMKSAVSLRSVGTL